MDNKNDMKFEYDIQKRAQAGMKATFRGVVAVYIAYLGYKLIRDAAGFWTVAAGVFFIAAAIGFGVYTWKRWHIDLEAAHLPDADDEPDDEEDTEEEDLEEDIEEIEEDNFEEETEEDETEEEELEEEPEE